MKKLLLPLLCFGIMGITTAKFVYDPVTNTFTYTSDTPTTSTSTVTTGTSITGITNTTTGTSATGTVIYTGTNNTGTATITTPVINTDIAGLLKQLDTNTATLLAGLKNIYATEDTKLSTTITQAKTNGTLGLALCFGSNQKSPDQLKLDLKNTSESAIKSLVEKVALLAGQLSSLEKQVQYDTMTPAQLNLALVGPKSDVSLIGDVTKNGSAEYTAALAAVSQSFASAVAKVASGGLQGASGSIARYNQFVALEKEYTDFSNKMGIQGLSLGVLPQLEQAKVIFGRLSVVEHRGMIQKNITAYIPSSLMSNGDILLVIDKAEREYQDRMNIYASNLLEDLTQIKDITDVANAVQMIRAIYKPQGDILCQAFAENPYILQTAPKISTQIQNTLSALANAAQRVALEKDILTRDSIQLQQGYLKALATFATATQNNSLSTLKANVSAILKKNNQTLLSSPRKISPTSTDTVIALLSKKMQEYTAAGRLSDFQAILTRASERLTTIKTKATKKQDINTIQAIETALALFL